MGHYDDCFARDSALRKGDVSREERLALLKKVLDAGGYIDCFDEDATHARWRMVANASSVLRVVPTTYKRFRIEKISCSGKTPPPEPGMIRHRFPVKMATEYICRGFIYEPNAKVQYPNSVISKQ